LGRRFHLSPIKFRDFEIRRNFKLEFASYLLAQRRLNARPDPAAADRLADVGLFPDPRRDCTKSGRGRSRQTDALLTAGSNCNHPDEIGADGSAEKGEARMNSKTLVASFCASAVALTLAFSSMAFAQGMAMKMTTGGTAGQYTVKTLTENAKVLVRDVVYKPGDIGPMQSRDGMVIYHITNSTVERTFADGSKQVVTHKAGEAEIINEKRPYSTKNTGKNTNHLIAVTLK
jgi:hypothetical protein